MAVSKLRFKDKNGADYSEWRKALVGDICTVTNGKGNTQDKIDNGAYPFYVRSDKVERSNKYIFDCEAVITSGDGVGVGKIYHYINGKFNLHQRCYAMFEFKNVLPRFFYYYFSTYFYKRVKRLSAKGSVDSVRLDFITKMNIPVPQLEEQQKIADFLTTFDKRITAQLNIIADMEEIKKGLLQKIFSQEIRFKDENGEDYPAWEKCQLNNICEKITDGSHFSPTEDENGLYYMLSVKDMRENGFYLKETKKINKLDYDLLVKNGCHPEVGDVLIAKDGSILKHVFTLKEEMPIVILSSIAIVRTNENILYNGFLSQYFKWDKFVNLVINQNKTGTGVPRIVLKNFKKLRLNIPHIEEQKKIASFLSTYDKKIEAEKKILADLQEMKKGLLQQLFV